MTTLLKTFPPSFLAATRYSNVVGGLTSTQLRFCPALFEVVAQVRHPAPICRYCTSNMTPATESDGQVSRACTRPESRSATPLRTGTVGGAVDRSRRSVSLLDVPCELIAATRNS